MSISGHHHLSDRELMRKAFSLKLRWYILLTTVTLMTHQRLINTHCRATSPRSGQWVVDASSAHNKYSANWMSLVFAKKRDECGRGVRYKARLVAKGFKQKFGVEFF
ncbi:hypothetical protein PHMEG_0002527 [Phytophthora megakarya]|uniref:Polyprotein n=1 Tax=Phytophthora megakarya TaxID=4795 RepID=A0A225WYI6_9STRA|nr:hypothetical protein PHMEG_0002527 [Phytophthora megakarya]